MSIQKNNIKIAMVSDAIYPYNKGGKEKRIFEMTTRLAKAGYKVTIYCMKWWEGKEQERIENGVRLHAISPLYPLYAGKRRSIKQAILFALSCFKLFGEDFDILDVDHMPHLILFPLKVVTAIKRKKFYTTWNEVWGRKYWNEYLGRLGDIAYVVEWISARLPDHIIAVSQHTKDMLISELKVTKPITVIPNGINLQEIEDVKPSEEKSDIMYAGRLLSHKNVDMLLFSVANLKKKFPAITVYIVGNGPEKENLEMLVKKLGIEKNVRFFDFLEKHTDLYALMKSSKVFVFPSSREGFGIVALEANASGIPVITADHKNNATKDLIKKGTNGDVFCLSENKLEDTIEKYLTVKNPSAYYKEFVKKYDWDALSTLVERIYQ